MPKDIYHRCLGVIPYCCCNEKYFVVLELKLNSQRKLQQITCRCVAVYLFTEVLNRHASFIKEQLQGLKDTDSSVGCLCAVPRPTQSPSLIFPCAEMLHIHFLSKFIEAYRKAPVLSPNLDCASLVFSLATCRLLRSPWQALMDWPTQAKNKLM